ncbi:MAG: type II toxin-antitoxin system PemK/MazF family toxin [Clostridia bacterium]|nr:type II toxin-antitoxin system PemK/MazF family toxin [Clostridia bacterium]
MVKQGTIIKINFNPQSGHEQAGFRPAVVVSNNVFNEKAKLSIVCPITNSNNKFPLHIPLDGRTKTTGVILCEHIKALDLNSRAYEEVEKLPKDILKRVIDMIYAEIEEI